MNPFDHARSSARLHGGCWSDYHPLHAWFDLTKSAHCHFTHRSLRHHREGIVEAVRVFGCAFRGTWAVISRDLGHAFHGIAGSHFTPSGRLANGCY